ncbi:hypothetical protein PAEPH01_1085, partial [Pancytospora epiphaga]
MPNILDNTYLCLFGKAISQTILGTPLTVSISLLVFIVTFFATRMLIWISDSIVALTSTFKTYLFESALKDFLIASCIALVLKYIPRVVYTIAVQEICRNQFVLFMSEYLNLCYTSFHRKTPGEIRYAIFLKSFASVMCAHLVVFEFSAMLGTVVFSFQKINSSSNHYSAIIFIVSPVVYLSAIVYYIKRKLVIQTEYLKQQEKVSSKLFDKLVNYEVIKTYRLENSESMSFFADLNGQMKEQINIGMLEATGSFIFSFLLIFPYILLVLLAYSLDSVGANTENLFKTTLLYISMSAQVKRLGSELIGLMMCLNQIKFTDIENLVEIDSNGQKREVDGFNQSIRFENVTLYYDSTEVIREINAEIRCGEKIGIVGPNGTGKSTFIKSLMGFTKYSGDIFFDNQNTRSLSWKSVIKQISYIPQDDYTSDDTVMNNLRLGDKNATDEFIVSRARAFGAHETFVGLPDGYETETGPRGNRLSGGQLQKLSLVRAAVKDAPIFVLDEATAAMDKSYESELLGKLFDILKDRTIIMIVHGKDYLAQFDRLFFFNNGRLEQ